MHQSITSDNPYVEIKYTEYILIQKMKNINGFP
ncbi:MAG: hypothetical protein ACLSC9_00640 [Barnesiella sp.]